MKKFVKYIAVLGAAMVAFACVNEPAEEIGPETNLPAGAVVFEGVATDCSRTLLTPNAENGGVLATTWKSADQIGIFETLTESANVLYTPAEEGAQVHFTSTSPISWKDESSEHTFYAYYPYAAEAATVDAVPFAVPATTDGSLAEAAAADLLYASATSAKVENLGLSFAHALAVLEVRLSTADGTLAVESLEVVAEEGEKINGEGTLNLTNGALTLNSGSNTTVVEGPEVISTTATTLYVPVTPGHAGKTLAIVLNGEEIFKKAVPAAGLPAGSQAVIAIDGLAGESADDTSATPTGTFDYAKLEAAAHPRLLINADDLKTLKTTVQTNAVAKQFHETILARCEEILGEGDLSKALVYNRLTAVSEKALERILFLSYGYRMTNKAEYLIQAEKDINAVCGWTDWNGENWIIDVAELTTAVALGYDWLHYDLNATTREAALEALTTNAATLTSTTNNSTNAICNSAAVLAGLATYEKGKAAAAALVDGAVAANLASGFVPYGKNGLGGYGEGYDHWAHSTTYEAILITALEKIFESDGGLYAANAGFVKSAEWALFMIGTSGKVFNYGDAQEEWEPKLPNWFFARKESNVDLLYNEKQLYDKGAYKESFSEFRLLPTIFALMDASQATATPVAPAATFWYANNGDSQLDTPVAFATNATHKLYLAAKGGRPKTHNGQQDGGSFVLDKKGVRLVCDLGGGDAAKYASEAGEEFYDYTNKGSKRWDIFRYTSLAHNIPNFRDQDATTLSNGDTQGKAFLDGAPTFQGSKWTLYAVNSDNTASGTHVGVGEKYYSSRQYQFSTTSGAPNGAVNIYDRFTVIKDCTYRWQVVVPEGITVTQSKTNFKLTSSCGTITNQEIKAITNSCTVNGTKMTLNTSSAPLTLTTFKEELTGEYEGYTIIGWEGNFKAEDEVQVCIQVVK
ncbi:MAG: fimbrillin family protein [Tidjanibacter sp.]|nr:fimbrillin family protein [Tidjanibacter sp.]